MTTSGQSIEIALNKKKIFLMLIGALVFIALGFWLVIYPPTISNTYRGNPKKIAIAAYASVLFFGLCAIVAIKKMKDKKPGLVIDQTGLTDNSSGVSAGLVLWSDIEEIEVIEIHRQKLIMLHVNNPKDYIEKQTSSFKRKMMQLNYKMYGTPISITSNALKISFNQLLSILKEKIQAARQA